jgi:hypothetical protein
MKAVADKPQLLTVKGKKRGEVGKPGLFSGAILVESIPLRYA